MKIIRMPIPTTIARRRVVLISSYLDGDHSPDDQVADEDHENSDRDQDPADEVLEHRPEVRRRDEVHEYREDDRQEGDQGARRPRLGGQRRDLTLDPDALPDRIRDVVEDLGQVSTDSAVDRVGSGDEIEVWALHPLRDVLKGLVRRAAEVHLADGAPELVG